MNHAGHAAHFLQRVDRLSGTHAELALGLYRDHGLVKFLLSRARLPSGGKRVALSLDDPKEGPFIIVTREGKFVTCLGRGMHIPHWQPLVKRSALDKLSEEAHELRRLIDESAKGNRSNTERLLQRVLHAGDSLCVEDFDELCSWGPLLGDIYLRGMLGSFRKMRETYALLCMKRRRAKRCDSLLRKHWQATWAAHHFLGLLGMERNVLLNASKDVLAEGKLELLAYLVAEPMATSALPFALRGAWLAAKLPRAFIKALEHTYQHPTNLETLYGCCFGLSALGIRHAHHRREVREHLSQPPAEQRWQSGGLARAITQLFPQTLRKEHIRNTRDGLDRHANATFEHIAAQVGGAQAQQVRGAPLEIRRAVLYNTPRALFGSPNGLSAGVAWLTQVSTGEPRDCYLPREYTSQAPDFDLNRALALYEVRRSGDTQRSPVPFVAETRPGRNDTCTCGSGKKYKRCCGLN